MLCFRIRVIAFCLLTLVLTTNLRLVNADSTFTYQGELTNAGAPAHGSFNFQFKMWNAVVGGLQIGSTEVLNGVSVSEGRFTVQLDFGANAFDNNNRWLEVIVNSIALSPRQLITRSPYAIQTRGIYVNDEGKVGLGSTLATEMLTIKHEDANILLLSQGNDWGPEITMRNTASGISTIHGSLIFDDGSRLAEIGYVKPFIGPDGLQFSDSVGATMKIAEGGNVGIGTTDPQTPLEVMGLIQSSGEGASVAARNPNNDSASVTLGWLNDVARIRIGGEGPGAGGGLDIQRVANVSLMRILNNGYVGLGTTDPQARLHVEGNARVNVLEVMGADLAERFPTSTTDVIEPGTVMEIDPENPGELRIATSAYSTLVAGVVSGANGLPAGAVMGNMEGLEDAPAVALTGRVWVHCDASLCAIRPGDLLTTSITPGHAMRVDDHTRAHGSVIGKAMTGLDEGKCGLVLVLVGLQ